MKEFKTSDGTLFANNYSRVVIGGAGAYIEFLREHIVAELETEPGQEYRGEGKYTAAKYFWLRPKGNSSVKVYLQRRTVDYADYKAGRYYVSPDELNWEGDLYAERSYTPNPSTVVSTRYTKP